MTFPSFKNARIVRSSWLEESGRRLDCNPYMSGALEARDILRSLSVRKDPLASLTAGHLGGIYNGPVFKRNYVGSSEFGVPFISSSSMLLADTSALPFLRKRDAQSKKLSYLQLREGTTLISCSGSVGRMAYVRASIDGMWSSQDVLKVVPNESLIPAGYLHAFLASTYGVPLVIAGTYGAIIQHLEPEHIASLPVPRYEEKFESEVSKLVNEAATQRSRAQSIIDNTLKAFSEDAKLSESRVGTVTDFATSVIPLSALNDRFDAPFHCASALTAERLLDFSPFPVALLADVAKALFKPPIFKRLWVDSKNYGRLFVSGNDIYRYQPEEERFVSRKTPKFDEFILKRGWLVFQAAGQIYGLFGRPLYVNGWLEDVFCADDVFRVVPENEIDGAFLYLFFRTDAGRVLIKRQATGNSIPRVWEPHMSKVRVLWPDADARKKYALPIIEAHELIENARLDEAKAIAMVEARIGSATNG